MKQKLLPLTICLIMILLTGQVNSQPYSVSGTITYNNSANTPINCTFVQLYDQINDTYYNDETDVNGYYEIQGLPQGNYQVEVICQITWGGVNSADALKILQYPNWTPLNPIQVAAGDVNGSGNINSIDALLTANRFVNNIYEFSVGDWYFDNNSTLNLSSNTTLNIQGLCYGDVNSSYTPPSTCACGTEPFSDNRDNQVYKTVQIGTQCWMKENLNYGTFITGPCHEDQITEKYCFNNTQEGCAIYGGFYGWGELTNWESASIQGICPDGYHIPRVNEYETMITFLGGETIAGGKLKESGLIHWNSPNTNATNSSGFTALGLGTTADFWLQYSNSDQLVVNYFHLDYSTANSEVEAAPFNTPVIPVRCIKN